MTMGTKIVPEYIDRWLVEVGDLDQMLGDVVSLDTDSKLFPQRSLILGDPLSDASLSKGNRSDIC